jgi:hypothetical protein
MLVIAAVHSLVFVKLGVSTVIGSLAFVISLCSALALEL